MSLENLMAEDLSKTLGGKNKLGVMPMPVRTTPIAPAPAAVNPLIDAPAKAPATAKAPAPEQTAPAIQSQPNTDRAERIRQRAASYPDRPSGASQYLGSGNMWRFERAQKEIDLEDQKAAAKEHLSWAGDSFAARNVQLGLRGVVDMGLGIKALAQHAVGSDEKAKETMKTIGERAETSKELSYGIVTSFDEAMSKGGFWNWVGSSILQQVPNMAASVATSGVGGFVGGLTRPAASAEIKAAGKNIISRSISDAVKKETARQIALTSAAGKTVGEAAARDAAEKIVRTKIGQQIGAFASGMALNTGENVSELYNRTGEFNTVGSLTAGAVKGALDSLFTSKTAGKLFNPGSASRKAIEEFNKSNSKFVLGVLGGIIADSGIEGTTEGLQYLVDEFTVYAQKPENYEKKPEQIWTEFLDNAAAAAVSSMALSSVSTYRDESAKRAEAKAMSAPTAPTPDPNAPAVNPLLAPEAAQGASAFDVPIGAPTATADAPVANQTPVNPLLATNQPTTNAADAELVRRSMATRGEAYAGIRAVEPVPSAAVAAVKEVSDKIGVRVIWIDGAPVGGRAVQGAAATGENAIMLHTDLLTNPKRDPVMMVYAHELTHRSERTSPKDYGILRDSVLARPDARASVEEKVAAGMGRAEAESEAVAEQVEVLGTDQAFWQEVFQGKDKSFVDHILAIIKDIADRVFGTNQAAKAEAIRGAAVQAFRAMQAQGQQTADSTLVNQPISEGVSSTPTTQEAQNGQVQGQAQEVAQNDAIEAQKRREANARRRETREAKAERARLREEKRKAEIEYNKFRRNSGMSRREAAKARRIYDFDRGDTPILNLITDQFGGIRAEDAKAFEVEKASLPRSIREKLFPSNGKGSSWNSVLWAIENENKIPGVLRADEVGAALSKEIKTIQSRAKEEKAQAQAYRQRTEDERGFKRAIIRDDKGAKVRREAVDLGEGDKLVRKIDGIPVEFTVADVEDTTGNIVLRSTLYGRQPVEYFEMVHADKYIPAKDAAVADAAKAEEVPFSTKKDEPTLAETASEIEDDAEREAFARSELERRAGIPIVAGPKNMAVLSQNHVVATAKDLLARLEEGEIDAVGALESLEAVEGRVGLAMERADRKAAKAAKAAEESRQQTLPGVVTPYGTQDDGSQGVLFSLAKPEDGQGREREFSISRFFRDELKRQWSATYRQKSAQQAISELEAITEKQGDDWVMDHLFDYSKETLAVFPMELRKLAARTVIQSADKAFRAWGINDDGSNVPSNPLIDKLHLKIQGIRKQAEIEEMSGGRSIAYLRSTYNNPVDVRKEINKIHDTLAAPVIGPVKMPVIDKVLNESKSAYDEAIAALEKERAENAILKEQLSSVHSTLKSANTRNLNRIFKMADESDAVRAAVDSHVAKILEELRAAGMAEGLSSKPDISLIQKIAQAYIWINRTTDEARVKAFLESKNIKIDDVAVSALVNDARIALGNAVRSAEKAAPRKAPAKRKGPTVLNRRPDMTIQPDELGAQRLFDSGKMWGDGVKLNIGEADAKRLALELTEAGQTIMRGISSNVEVVISNALRRGRNRAGLEKVLIESGIDERTAKRMARNITERRAALVRPALETLRKKYADKGDKVSRTIASAMDKIMEAMNLADVASKSQVSGFFDGNAWDESRRIVEDAFGFKSEITRDWFNETMRIYREYEKADEAGNHVLSSSLHTDLLNRVAHVKNKGDWWLAARAYIQGGMLSSLRTHEWNLMSTASRAFGFAYVQATRQFIRLAQTGNPKYLAGAYLPFEMLFRSHGQATSLFRHIMKTDVNPFVMRVGDEAKFGTDPNTASAAEYMPFFQWKLNRGFKYIGRLLRAADAYFRVGIENSDIVMRSYNSLIKNGEKVPDAIKRSVGLVGFVTDGTNDAYNKASKKADELGLVGFDRKMNILIDMRNALDPEYLEKANLRGAIETFNDPDPEGIVGGLADWARHHSSDPGMFWMGMFARVGANLFNHMQHTAPLWSAAMLAKDATIGRYKGGKSNVKIENKEDIEIRAVRAATSLALATLVVGLCLKSLKDFDDDDEQDETKKKYKFMLTAGGPSDTSLRKNWEKVEKPYTISVNGRDFSYKWMSGLTAVLAMAGAWMDEKRYGSLKDESIDGRNAGPNLDLVLNMSFGMMDAMTSDIPGQALIDFFDVIKTAGKPGSEKMRGMEKWAEKNLASFGSSLIPYSRAVIDVDRIIDGESTTARNMAGMKGFFFSTFRDIPYVRNRLLYPYRDIWGEPITYPANADEDMGIGERSARYMLDRFINNTKNDPDIKFLVSAQARIRAPYPNETSIITTEDGKYGLRNMTDKEYDEFLVLFGAELRTQIGFVRELYNSSEQYKKYIRPDNETLKKSISEARSNAMKWAMYKYLTKTGKQVVKNKE